LSHPTAKTNASMTCFFFTDNFGEILNFVFGFIYSRGIFVVSDNDIGSFEFGGGVSITSGIESFINSGSDIMYISIKV